jgi:hypothetical protein
MEIESRFITVADSSRATDGRIYCEFDVLGGERWLVCNAPVTANSPYGIVARTGPAHFPLVPYRVKMSPVAIAALSAYLGALVVAQLGDAYKLQKIIQAVGNPVVTTDVEDEVIVHFGFALQLKG